MSHEENVTHDVIENTEAATETAGLHRRLKNRHIQMIALGGCIGTGLFYGSAEAISMAGPAILIAYLLGGIAIFFVMRAVGEMSVRTPVAGAFTYHAYANWSDRAGFVSGWNYWFNYILVSMVELAVVGLYLNYWLPDFPAWATATICLVLITAVNLIGVRSFGEFEFWFAMIKVLAIVAMIVVGLIIVFASIHNPGTPVPSFYHLIDPATGGFLPFGIMSQIDGAWVGLVMAMVVVMFSFGGVELIAITAGEADNPTRTIPKAINQIAWRILLFFIGTLTIIMAVVPWQSINGKMSPFVQIFDYVGFKAGAALLNFVCITAVLSVYNSAVYSNGRMLHSLAHQGNAPRFLGKVARNGVPIPGILASAGITVIAVIVVFLWPDFAFNYLMSVALISGIINWIMVMVTELKFRSRIGPDEVSKLSFKLPFQPLSNYLVIAFLAFVVVMMCFSPGYRIAVIIGPIWLAVLLVAYQVKKTGQTAIQTTHSQ
ncbi:MAG: amino acid permease [Propionibacteriaceae bacterium]|jgi:L-asparagine transporter-like permease|nr:amino acid permease [Propionibacteriaceae bacterium]